MGVISKKELWENAVQEVFGSQDLVIKLPVQSWLGSGGILEQFTLAAGQREDQDSSVEKELEVKYWLQVFSNFEQFISKIPNLDEFVNNYYPHLLTTLHYDEWHAKHLELLMDLEQQRRNDIDTSHIV